MSKNKKTQVKNVFKVAGMRSLKARKKAKSVQGTLKKLTERNKQNAVNVDQQLSQLQKEIRQNVKEKVVEDKKRGDLTAQNITAENVSHAFEKLSKLKM